MVRRLSDAQVKKLSDIGSDIGIVALASVAIPAFLERTDIFITTMGLISSIFFWLFSL